MVVNIKSKLSSFPFHLLLIVLLKAPKKASAYYYIIKNLFQNERIHKCVAYFVLFSHSVDMLMLIQKNKT
jgi:hypothetical protein